jgi:hypothetical protein
LFPGANLSLEYLCEAFWLDLRDKIRLNTDLGKGECRSWCSKALDLLKEQDTQEFCMVTIGNIPLISTPPFLTSHSWLVYKNEDVDFVADGTAGQIDPKFSRGYYGFIKDAPFPFREIYSTPHDERIMEFIVGRKGTGKNKQVYEAMRKESSPDARMEIFEKEYSQYIN